MKALRAWVLLAGLAVVAGCVQKPAPPPPGLRPAPAPTPSRPVPSPPPPRADWRDIPLSPGGWSYAGHAEGSEARFGPFGGQPAFTVRCERARRQIVLARAGTTTGAAMTVRTSFGARNFPVTPRSAPVPGAASSVTAHDPFLDSMAFSRGRFTVELPGTAMLVIPSWPEPARVIEDCRK
mgnify:CR=1 FL=1